MDWIIAHWAELSAGIGALLAAAVAFARITKPRRDDQTVAWLLRLWRRIAGGRTGAALLIALTLGVSGCAGQLNKITTNYPTGETVTQEISDEALFYQVQTRMAQARKPILVMEARKGENIELKGVKKLVVWGYADDRGRLRTYEHPWAKAIREWGGIVGMLGSIYLGGQVAVELADTVGKHAGSHTTITDAYKTSGSQSPVVATGGGAGSATVTDSHNITSSYNDSHDSTSP